MLSCLAQNGHAMACPLVPRSLMLDVVDLALADLAPAAFDLAPPALAVVDLELAVFDAGLFQVLVCLLLCISLFPILAPARWASTLTANLKCCSSRAYS